MDDNKMEKQDLSQSMASEQHILPLLGSFRHDFDHSFEESDEIDEDRCYIMEIEQLKRENGFLKKKIAELNKRHFAFGSVKRRSLPPNIKPPVPITQEPTQNYIVSFFEEVTRLLESFSSLFRVGVETSLKEQLRQHEKALEELTATKDRDLHRRLGRLLLQPEEKRYDELLGLFEGYYRENKQKSRNLKARVEQLTEEAIELGKKMAENVRTRERAKESRMVSMMTDNEPFRVNETFMKESFIKSTCTDEPMQEILPLAEKLQEALE